MVTLLYILDILLGFGLAGILIIIGAIAVIMHVIKSIIARIYFAIHMRKPKGGDKE